MPKVKTRLIEKMHFASTDGECQDYHMSASEDHGGENKYTTPMRLVLMGLTGCSGMDIISIARKMKQDVTDFNIEANAENADDHPHVYTKILLTFTFSGKDLEESKLKKAVDLSLDKYCSVSAMLRSTAKIEYKIILN